MPVIPSSVRRRGLDALTIALFLFAAYLLAQPGSQLRSAWARNRAQADAVDRAERFWHQVAAISSPLFAGTDPLIVEVSDYECPFCRRNTFAVDSAVSAGARIGYLHLPLPSHPRAEGAAKAALCAEKAGQFPAMHARLMGTEQWRRDSNWTREAGLAGVSDLEQFEQCMRGKEVAVRLSHHKALAESLQVTVTPTFLSRRAVHRGLATRGELLQFDR